MRSKVYFTDMRARSGYSLHDKVERLFDAAGFGPIIEKGQLVAIKLHVGEPGNVAFLPPPLVRAVVQKVKARGAKPFLTDANTLYRGRRANAVDHAITAIEHGFDYSVVGAPFLVADGLWGHDHVKVSIDGVRLGEARIGSVIAEADALIALTHFKGHEATGFGGALKNLGMGCASRSGKQIQHSDLRPRVDPEKCTRCARCISWCPQEAISLTGVRGAAAINYTICIGCAECTITCTHRAIAVNWEEGEEGSLQERMAEYSLAVVKTKEGRCGYFNFIMNVSPGCDCFGFNDAPVVPNLGILASNDPVAIDQASVDLVNSAAPLRGTRLGEGPIPGGDVFRTLYPRVDWSVQLRHGERIGLGTRDYELIRLD